MEDYDFDKDYDDDYDDDAYDVEDDEDHDPYDDDYDSDEEDDYFDDDKYDDPIKDTYHDASYYEALGIEDGRFDKDHHMFPHSGFGSSVDLSELDDDQREAYELGYGIGAEDYDLTDDEQ